MAKIQAGILSNVRGAVAGVVGGVWKGKNYVRARVTPANPNSAAQQLQRGKMASCVAFAKLILGPILQPYVDPFQKTMSAFNWFVKKNIALFTETPDYSTITISEGTLFPATIADAEPSTDIVTLTLETSTGSNGLATDMITAVVRDAATGRVFTAGTPVARSVGTLVVACPGFTSESDGMAWAVTYRLDGSKVVLVGNSQALVLG
jgi:hypothetical protein